MIIQVDDKQVLIDDADYELIKPYKWFIQQNGYVGYTPKGTQTSVAMHRVLFNLTKPWQEADHINKDLLDNRRCNLRLCTRQQNSFNRGKNKNGLTSTYRGVSYSKREKYFCAFIKVNYDNIYLFRSKNEHECGYGYNVAARYVAKDFASLNEIKEQVDEERIKNLVISKLMSKGIKPI